jgi:hypothetical protein
MHRSTVTIALFAALVYVATHRPAVGEALIDAGIAVLPPVELPAGFADRLEDTLIREQMAWHSRHNGHAHYDPRTMP